MTWSELCEVPGADVNTAHTKLELFLKYLKQSL